MENAVKEKREVSSAVKAAYRKERIKEYFPFVGLVVLVALFTALSKGKFVTSDNLSLIIDQSFTLMLTSLVATFIYAHGSLDVSLGSVCMMSCICSVLTAIHSGSGVLAFLVCVAVSLACALVVSLISCKLRVMAFVSSLCVSFICQGLAGQLMSTGEIVMPGSVVSVVNRPVVKIIVIIVAIIVCYILFEHTKIGHYNKAIGGNAVAAAQSGIPVNKYKIIAYTICGIMLGIASFFLVCRVATATTTTGNGLHMDVMLSVILGGMSIRGGPKSRITAPIIGSLITYTLSNGLTICGVDAYYVQFIQGIIFLVVIFTVFPRKKQGALPA